MARALNLDWREVTFGEDDFWRVLPEVAWALDEPTTDYATLPTYKLAEAAKGTLKVVLTGEGGDELFAGYGRYRSAMRPWWLGGRATWRPRHPASLESMCVLSANTPLNESQQQTGAALRSFEV